MDKALSLIYNTEKKITLSKYTHNFSIYNNTGAVEMAHLVRPCLHEHEDLSLDLQHMWKLRQHVPWRSRDTWIPSQALGSLRFLITYVIPVC